MSYYLSKTLIASVSPLPNPDYISLDWAIQAAVDRQEPLTQIHVRSVVPAGEVPQTMAIVWAGTVFMRAGTQRPLAHYHVVKNASNGRMYRIPFGEPMPEGFIMIWRGDLNPIPDAAMAYECWFNGGPNGQKPE